MAGLSFHGHLSHDSHGRDARATWETAVLFALKGTGRHGVPRDVNAFAPLLQRSSPCPARN